MNKNIESSNMIPDNKNLQQSKSTLDISAMNISVWKRRHRNRLNDKKKKIIVVGSTKCLKRRIARKAKIRFSDESTEMSNDEDEEEEDSDKPVNLKSIIDSTMLENIKSGFSISDLKLKLKK